MYDHLFCSHYQTTSQLCGCWENLHIDKLAGAERVQLGGSVTTMHTLHAYCTPKSRSSGIKSSLAQLVRQWTSDPEMRCEVGVQAQVRTVPLVFGIKFFF